jgi:alpha-tubulin suppressor-like RCC1 family protein
MKLTTIFLYLYFVLPWANLLADESVLKFSSSSTHTLLGLKDGSAFGAGLNGQGQLGSGQTLAETFYKESSLTNIVDCCAGENFSLWVDATGQVWGAGNNQSGILLSPGPLLLSPQVITNQANLIATGPNFVYMVDNSGALWTWGEGRSGQLGDGSQTSRYSPLKITDGPVTSIDCGLDHGCFVTASGNLYGMGNNFVGALGGSDGFTVNSPKLLASSVLMAKAGDRHTVFLKTDGSVWTMGEGSRGQLGDGSASPLTTAKRVINSGIINIAAGSEHTLVLTQLGNLFAAGANDAGQLGLGTTNDSLVFNKVLGSVTQIWADEQRSYFTKSNGEIVGVGNNTFAQLGVGLFPLALNWTSVLAEGVQGLSSSVQYSLIVKTDGSLWGIGDLPLQSSGIHFTPQLLFSSNVLSVSTGEGHALIIRQDRSVWAFGKNAYGQLGDGTVLSKFNALQVHAGPAAAVSVGDSHSLILLQDGSLWAAGDNSNGQLGQSSTVDQSAEWLAVATDVQAMVAGAFHNIVLKTDGSVCSFGRGAEGQLGGGSSLNRFAPAQILSQGQKVEASYLSSYVIDAGGNLLVFGSNRQGQLGSGNLLATSNPIRVSANVQQVSASKTHVLFKKTDGSLFTMGTGYLRPGGNEISETLAIPMPLTPPADLNNVDLVMAGGDESLNQSWALLSTGNLLGLGHHRKGELGLGQQNYRSLPVYIGGGSALVTTSENIVITEAEILEINESELQAGDEILDQDTGPQLRQISGSAGGCLLRISKTQDFPSKNTNAVFAR